MNFKRKTRSILITFLLLGGVITSTGCQAASDMFNPDTYSWNYNKEPWEKNFKKSAPKKKNVATDF